MAPFLGLEPRPLDSESNTLPPGPEVIKLFSSSAQLSMIFQLLRNIEIFKISGKFSSKLKNW